MPNTIGAKDTKVRICKEKATLLATAPNTTLPQPLPHHYDTRPAIPPNFATFAPFAGNKKLPKRCQALTPRV